MAEKALKSRSIKRKLAAHMKDIQKAVILSLDTTLLQSNNNDLQSVELDFAGTSGLTDDICPIDCVEQFNENACLETSGDSSFAETSSDRCSSNAFSEFVFSSESDNAASQKNLEMQSTADIPSLADKLQAWALKYDVTHHAVSGLLKLLGEYHSDLPKDARTLLKSERRVDKFSFGIPGNSNGEMCYFGIVNGLKQYDISRFANSSAENNLFISVNIDGLPLFKSSSRQFWPILGKIDSNNQTCPFVIACYCGTTKPPSINEFLRRFIDEAKLLEIDGISYNGSIYSVKICKFLCDAPARCFIKCIKGHTGYYSCEYCVQKGVYFNNRVVYPEMNAEKRTDSTFNNQIHEDHHTGVSPLTELKVGLVTQVPLDYMHLCCLGVMRKLLMAWTKGPRHVKLGGHHINQVSQNLVNFAACIPSEFARKPRALKEIERWKATEFRLFMLYIGPIVLKRILPNDLYQHFLEFHVAMSILSNPKSVSDNDNISYAESILQHFVSKMEELYGKESLVYNVHNLLHLSENVRHYGCLDNFSCFPFENFLGRIKKKIRSPANPLAQLSKRLSEDKNIGVLDEKKDIPCNIVFINLNTVHQKGPNEIPSDFQFMEITYKNKKFKTSNNGDCNVIMKNGKIVKIRNFVCARKKDGYTDASELKMIYQEYPIFSDSFYDYPCNSKLISIFKIGQLSETFHSCSICYISHKCIINDKVAIVVHN